MAEEPDPAAGAVDEEPNVTLAVVEPNEKPELDPEEPNVGFAVENPAAGADEPNEVIGVVEEPLAPAPNEKPPPKGDADAAA